MEQLNFIYNSIIDLAGDNLYFKFLLLILLAFLVATIVDKIIITNIKKLIGKTKTDLDDRIIDTLHSPLYVTILFIGFNFALDSVKSNPEPEFYYYLKAIIKTVIVYSWAKGLFSSFTLIIKWYSNSSKSNKFIKKKTLPLFDNLGKIIIFVLSIYFLMLCWGINVTAWVASAGIVSVVLGFAAKDTLGNLFAGVFIMADSPYKEGDYINLDTGERGYVTSIGIRSTRIQTRDDIEITIPNSVIAMSKIVNESGGPSEKERIRINIEISYGSKVEVAKDIMHKIAVSSQHICKDPEPRVRFRQFGQSGLLLQLLAWIEKPELRGLAIDELSTSIYNEFNKAGLEFPFPQRTVHIKKSDL